MKFILQNKIVCIVTVLQIHYYIIVSAVQTVNFIIRSIPVY